MSVAQRAILPALAIAFITSHAAADCATGADYNVTISANTVTVCPASSARHCDSSIEFLRQSEADGTVSAVGYCSNGCYVDECVPGGKYRYGYALPYDCSESGCGSVALFAEVSVTSVISSSCARATGDSGPTASTTVPPWGANSSANLSRFKTCDSSSGGCATASPLRKAIRWFDGLSLALGLLLMCLGARRRRRSVNHSSWRDSR